MHIWMAKAHAGGDVHRARRFASGTVTPQSLRTHNSNDSWPPDNHNISL